MKTLGVDACYEAGILLAYLAMVINCCANKAFSLLLSARWMITSCSDF